MSAHSSLLIDLAACAVDAMAEFGIETDRVAARYAIRHCNIIDPPAHQHDFDELASYVVETMQELYPKN